MVVAVDDDRADVDDAVGAGRLGGVEHRDRPADVDAHEVLHLAPVADVRRRVDDEVGALERAAERLAVGDVGLGELGAGGAHPVGGGGVDLDPGHGRALVHERAADRAADEPAGARDGCAAPLEPARFGSRERPYTRPTLSWSPRRRRSRRSGTAVRAAAVGALAAGVAVPLAAKAAADPEGRDGRVGRRRARRARGALPTLEQARRRALRAPDVGLHRPSRASLRRARGAAAAAADPVPDPRRPADRWRRAADRSPAARARLATTGQASSTACSRSPTGPGSSSPT